MPALWDISDYNIVVDLCWGHASLVFSIWRWMEAQATTRVFQSSFPKAALPLRFNEVSVWEEATQAAQALHLVSGQETPLLLWLLSFRIRDASSWGSLWFPCSQDPPWWQEARGDSPSPILRFYRPEVQQQQKVLAPWNLCLLCFEAPVVL